MPLVVVTDPQLMAAIRRLFSRVVFVILPGSVLFIKYYPQLGRFYDSWTEELTRDLLLFGADVTSEAEIGLNSDEAKEDMPPRETFSLLGRIGRMVGGRILYGWSSKEGVSISGTSNLQY
jgi:hypothetical protein